MHGTKRIWESMNQNPSCINKFNSQQNSNGATVHNTCTNIIRWHTVKQMTKDETMYDKTYRVNKYIVINNNNEKIKERIAQ